MSETVGSPLLASDPGSVGPWVLDSRLGAGGMGVVYHAHAGPREAAVKVIRPGLLDSAASRDRFRREVEILRAVRDVHISAFLDADLESEPAWLAVEYVSGPVLSAAVGRDGALPEDQWWELARGLSQALAVLEVHRVTHRDIKPSNVILNARGPVLIDFGIAHPEDAASLTATGLVTGSPAWLSPEQANLQPPGPASDVFTLGSLLAYAATGRPPFGEGVSIAILMSIATREPDLDGIDPERTALLHRMLAKEPADRPTAREVLDIARTRVSGGPDVTAPMQAVGADAATDEPVRLDATAVDAHLAEPTAPDLDLGPGWPAAGGAAAMTPPLAPAASAPAAPVSAPPVQAPPMSPPPVSAPSVPTPPVPVAATPAPAPRGAAPARPAPPSRGPRWGPVLLGLLAVALLAGVAWLLLGGDPQDGATPNPGDSPSATDPGQAPPAPASDQLRDGDWLLESYRIGNQGGKLTVSGTVRNRGTDTASSPLTTWVYVDGQSLGSVSTTVTDVPAGGAVPVVMTGDATWAQGAKVLLLQAG